MLWLFIALICLWLSHGIVANGRAEKHRREQEWNDLPSWKKAQARHFRGY